MIKPIKVTVYHYQTDDGSVFPTEYEALDYEFRQKGKRVTCPECDGDRQMYLYGDQRIYVTCSYCFGKGYIDK